MGIAARWPLRAGWAPGPHFCFVYFVVLEGEGLILSFLVLTIGLFNVVIDDLSVID